MQLNENLLIEQRANQYSSIFRKIDIYNARKQVLNENQYNDIRFTLTEQEAIKEMFQIMAYKILDNNLPGELNEGFWDSIKQGAQNIKDKVNTGVKKLQQLPEKAKKAYEFCQQIIQKSVTKVSELIRYIAELLAKLADKVKDAIMQLGGFGKNEITEAEDPFTQYPDDEKQFLAAVFEYAQQKKGDNRLTEGWLDKFEEKDQKQNADTADNKEQEIQAETVQLTPKYNTNLSESVRKLGYNKDYIKLTEDWINKNGLN